MKILFSPEETAMCIIWQEGRGPKEGVGFEKC